MKVILTEDQIKLIKTLNEQTEFVAKTMDAIKDMKKAANGLYGIITFATIAEIRDGDFDIPRMEQRVGELKTKSTHISRRISEFFDRYTEDEYYAKRLDDVQNDLEARHWVADEKIDALEDIINHLKPFSKVNEYGEGRDNDWDKPFDDIKPINA